MNPVDPRTQFRNRIDYLKRLGKKLDRMPEIDTEKYVRLSNGQVITKETCRKGLYVNGSYICQTT